MRTVHFIGIETLFHLMIGTYHRPVVERKVMMFLDIDDSTGLAGRLGSIAGGTDEIQRSIISERVLKMPRERTGDTEKPFKDVPRNTVA
jgi:hypothetical protein